jgi:hypothetical protein
VDAQSYRDRQRDIPMVVCSQECAHCQMSNQRHRQFRAHLEKYTRVTVLYKDNYTTSSRVHIANSTSSARCSARKWTNSWKQFYLQLSRKFEPTGGKIVRFGRIDDMAQTGDKLQFRWLTAID